MLQLSTRSWLALTLAISGLVGAQITVPDCQTVAPPEYTLNNVQTAQTEVAGAPFAVEYAHQKHRAFASVNSSLVVLNTSTFAPQVLHSIPLPASLIGGAALGIAITHDGKYVYVAGGRGAAIVSSAKALAGNTNAIVGSLAGPASGGSSAIQVVISKDDKYAFVAQEYGNGTIGQGNVEVFALHPNKNETVTSTYVGNTGLGLAVAGITLSPDGQILYATSEKQSVNSTQGTLSLLNVTKLQTTPCQSLIQAVQAGCGPVRILPSKDGKTVWVTARESNRLLAFDVAKIRGSTPRNALIASVQVGTSPVGLTFARNETRILTANSNRFNYANATTGLTVVDVQGALKPNAKILLGQIPTGKFPREFGVSPDGKTILVTEYGSDEIQALNVTTLP